MVNPGSPSRMCYEMHSLIVGDFGLVMTSLVTIVDLSDLSPYAVPQNRISLLVHIFIYSTSFLLSNDLFRD